MKEIETYDDLWEKESKKYGGFKMNVKRTITKSVGLNFNKHEETITFEYDIETPDDVAYVEELERNFTESVFENGKEWYHKIRESDEYKQAERDKKGFNNSYKQGNDGYKSKSKSGGKGGGFKNAQKKSNYKSRGGNPNPNSSEEANAIVNEKGFGTGKQFDAVIKHRGEERAWEIEDYGELQRVLKGEE